MIVSNRQLDLSQICVDLGIQPYLRNERSCAIGHSLVEGVVSSADPTVYYVPLTAGSTEKCRVILHENPYGRSYALTACSCADWQIHHRDGIGIIPLLVFVGYIGSFHHDHAPRLLNFPRNKLIEIHATGNRLSIAIRPVPVDCLLS